MIYVYAAFVFLFTVSIGSFLNVVIYRLPQGMSLSKPGSHCPKCGNPIKWYDNIPIFSYIFLGGKCRHCKCRISPQYVIVEALTGIISTLIFLRFGVSFTSLFGIVLFLVLIPIAFIDIEHYIIYDRFIIILLVLGVLGIFFNDLDYAASIKIDYLSKIIGAGSVVIFGFIIILLEKLLKRDLMGGGDIKLMFACSLILGWQLTLLGIGIASILASVIEIVAKAVRDKKKVEEPTEEDLLSDEEKEIKEFKKVGLFPFGPYLAIGIMVAYVFGLNIINAWLNFLSF